MQPCAVILACALACAADGPRAIVRTADGSTAAIALEVMDTPATRERGMMYRQALAEHAGMLFVFPDEAERSFWMKNTLVPLDMLFIAHDGRIVGIHEHATPLSTAPISVGAPSIWVIEVNGGWAARHGVRAGDRVELHGVRGAS